MKPAYRGINYRAVPTTLEVGEHPQMGCYREAAVHLSQPAKSGVGQPPIKLPCCVTPDILFG